MNTHIDHVGIPLPFIRGAWVAFGGSYAPVYTESTHADKHQTNCSPATTTSNRQILNVPAEMLSGALQLYSPANIWSKFVKINSISVTMKSKGSTLGTWQLHSSMVSVLPCLMTVLSRYQFSAKGGLDLWLQARVTLPPSGITSGMPGPTGGWMVNSITWMHVCNVSIDGKMVFWH